MADDSPVASVEIGSIVFRSWEHEWQTDQREAPSVASAKRLLPSDLTRPIYEILGRWERDLLRSSFPLSPYGLRIRAADNRWMDLVSQDGSDHLAEMACRMVPIHKLCPGWDEAVSQLQQKRTKYGVVREASASNITLNDLYEVIWRSAIFPEQPVNIDQLLRRFSPRYKEPPIFGYMPGPR